MVTPFTENNEIDYYTLESLIEWYLSAGVDGLFAVCQSSEMFYLSLIERVQLASFVVKRVNGRVPVIASGHISRDFEKQVQEMKRIAATGVDAAVLITNRFGGKEEQTDSKFFSILEQFLYLFQEDIPLGFYECPFPYKRLFTPELLQKCAATKRFMFLKDTSCDLDQIKSKLNAVKGTGLKIYNANSATLLQSLQAGVAGYSGILANFFPELFVWLIRNWHSQPDLAAELQNFLGAVAAIEKRVYPICAKQYLQMEGINIRLDTRAQKISDYCEYPSFRTEISQLRALARNYIGKYRDERA
jgi:4-hydroxy-tetrahydrodipicolinate synthase